MARGLLFTTPMKKPSKTPPKKQPRVLETKELEQAQGGLVVIAIIGVLVGM